MKKLYVIAVLLLTTGVGTASASVGDMPSSDALSFGKNAQGCYYTSQSQKLVYSKDFSLVMDKAANCERSFVVHPTLYISPEIAEWRATTKAYLMSLVK